MTVKSVKSHQSVWESDTGIYELGTVQKVAVAAASAAVTNAFASTTEAIRVAVTTNCYIKFGAAPVATTSDHLIPAGTVEFFKLPAGATKVAFIRDTADGSATVTELA